MKKKVTLGMVARALSANMFVVGMGMMVGACLVGIAGSVLK